MASNPPLRKFGALPMVYTLRCGNCKRPFTSEENPPEKCPACDSMLKTVGYSNVMDEVPTRRV